MALGKNWSGELLYPSFDPATFADRLTNVLQTPRSLQFGTCGPKAVAASVNDLDPLQAGWTFVVSANDPRRNEYIEALQPLAIHRGMTNPATPLLFKAGVDNVREWHTWLQHSYLSADLQGRKLPRYMLFVGGPEMLPFRFQAMMDSVAHVGRLSFDRIEDLRAYVDKVVRIEKAPEPVVEREMLMFATDGGRNDPTYYSCRFMARPLADYVEQTHGVAITRLFGKDATKQALKDRLHSSRPAIVYAASHGLGLTADSDEQRRYNGAICCQTDGPLRLDTLFSADDVPDTPFLEGSIWFQFGCYSYGTPAMSDFAHLPANGAPEKQTDHDFIAALPKRLLAHPRGPLAFVGHVDTAYLHAFTDPDEPEVLGRWHVRMAPFVSAVDRLLDPAPAAYAMQRMNDTYNLANQAITTLYDNLRRGTLTWTPELQQKFVDDWIFRSDAQNYLVLGDPATLLQMPTR